MNLDELFSRHQVALIGMEEAASPGGRAWAEECADYYADRIGAFGDRLGGAHAYRKDLLKAVLRG